MAIEKEVITKVENGFIVQHTEFDRVNGRPQEEVYIFSKFDEVADFLCDKAGNKLKLV